jgi:putative hydrolase of HD superfamily
MPVLLNPNKNGGSWLENGVSYERVVDRVGPEIESGCPELWEYLKPQLEARCCTGFFATSAHQEGAISEPNKNYSSKR